MTDLENYLRFDDKSIYTFFDVETQNLCLHHFWNLPWQVGLIRTQGNKILEEKTFYIYWGEQFRMSKKAAFLTGFNKDTVKDEGISSIQAATILEDEFKQADFLCGHNILGFDIPIVQSFFKKVLGYQMDFEGKKFIDTYLFARGNAIDFPYKKDIEPLVYQLKVLNSNRRAKGLKLSNLAQQYGIPYDEEKLHDANYDLKINVAIWNKMKWTIDI